MSIFESKYKDVDSIVIENSQVKASFIRYGAKMVSLVYKATGKELLWQNTKSDHYHIPKYLDDYESGEFSGFDEMFPTITPCVCDEYPFKGVSLPDHGEVWSLEWDAQLSDDAVRFEVYGVRIPYRLAKTVTFDENGCLITGYEAHNLSEFDMRYIWAAHPLFVLEDDMHVRWDTSQCDLMITANKSGTIGKFGDVITNTAKFIHEGLGELCDRDYLKYYVVGNNAPSECELEYRDGTQLAIAYISNKNRCLGFWINNGGMQGQYNIAPEFCSASMDNIIAAREHGSHCILGPQDTDAWTVTFAITKNRKR